MKYYDHHLETCTNDHPYILSPEDLEEILRFNIKPTTSLRLSVTNYFETQVTKGATTYEQIERKRTYRISREFLESSMVERAFKAGSGFVRSFEILEDGSFRVFMMSDLAVKDIGTFFAFIMDGTHGMVDKVTVGGSLPTSHNLGNRSQSYTSGS